MMHARGAMPVSCSVLLDLKSRSYAENVQVSNKQTNKQTDIHIAGIAPDWIAFERDDCIKYGTLSYLLYYQCGIKSDCL